MREGTSYISTTSPGSTISLARWLMTDERALPLHCWIIG
jgi:hypothetical protein